MRITLMAIADYASVSIGDKLNVLGIFDTIFASRFPAQHPHMVFAARIEFDFQDGSKRFESAMWLEDEDGQRPIQTPANIIEVAKLPPGEMQNRNIIVELSNLQFSGPGTYRFFLRVGDTSESVPFRVVERR